MTNFPSSKLVCVIDEVIQLIDKAWTTKEFKYQCDFDVNGVVYNLGTDYGSKPWTNPATSNKLKLSSSGIKNDSKHLSSIVGREVVRCVLAWKENSWFVIDFGNNLKICPTYYTLKHYLSWDIEALRCWNLEGSINGKDWILIKNHDQDKSLKGQGKSASWPLKTNDYFSKFRIFMTDKNDSDHYYLCCSGFEIYGTVKRETALINLPIPKSNAFINDLLIYGFYRKYSSHSNCRIDSNLFQLIFDFYNFSLNIIKSQFHFNENKTEYKFITPRFGGDEMEFSDKNHVILNGECILMIDYLISKEMTNHLDINIFEWEIEMNKIKGIAYIGFVDGDIFMECPKQLPRHSSVNGFCDFIFDNEQKKYDFAMSIQSNKTWFCRYSKYHNNDRQIECHIPFELLGHRNEFRNGDIFRLRVNFKTKTCDVYVNNKLLKEKLFENIPKRIIPGISGTGEFTVRFVKII